MESISTIEQLNECFVNNTPILFIKKYPEYDLRKEGVITSIDFITNMILINVEKRIFYKVKFDDVTIYKI
jgi:hypothetical protein